MTTRITMDGAGRVVLPKPLREEFELSAGDTLELETGGGNITLRPVRNRPALAKEKGVWVFRTGQRLPAATVDEVLQRDRAERDHHNSESRE